MRPSADRSRESGAVLPIFALLIVILLAFAALAVDLGAAWAQRRQSQTAADAGVMAAALQYLRNTPPDQTGIFELVNLYANANLSGPDLTYDDWHNCTDPDRPADYAYLGQDGDWEYPSGSAASTPCISLKQADDQPAVLRVRLPDTDISTAFARVVGIDTIAVTAAAEAEILYTESSRILPFSLPSEPNLEECLGTPPTGLLPQDVAPCEGSTQGNFGMVDSPWFGAGAPYGTDTQSCPNDPNFRSRTPLNLALGLDHIITSWPDLDGDELTYDGPDPGETQSASDPVADSCDNVDSDLPPYILLTEPGNTQTGSEIMQAGFLEGPFGTAGTYGRFRQTTGTNPTHDIAVTTNGATLNLRDNTLNVSVDNVGLWEYLDFDGNSFNNTACAKKSFEDAVGRQLTEQMSLCLDYIETLEDGQYFTDDILTSPRFALVPVLNYERGSQYGSKWWAVMELRPVYVQTSWYLCGQPTGDCLFQPDDFENYTPVNAPVWVKLTSPAYGSPLTGSITVNAKTGGENGAASVSFYVDGDLIDTDTNGGTNFSVTWDTTTINDGPVTLSAVAFDDSGNTATDSIAVIIDNNFPAATPLDTPPTQGKSVFFNPGEGSEAPCIINNQDNCVPPDTLEMAGTSAFVLGKNWLSEDAKNAIGNTAPYQVYLVR